MRKPLFPSVPDSTSLKNLLEMGYAITPTGAAWPSNKGWEKPNGSPFPMPALIFKIESNWRPSGVAINAAALTYAGCLNESNI